MKMLVYPEYLFYFFLKRYKPEIILDIGSRDGRESMKFRSISPESRIIAFEANPYNYESMLNDIKLNGSDVVIVNKAVSNHTGNIDFFRIETDEEWKSGASSIFSRTSDNDNEKIEIPVITLDEYLSGISDKGKIAMWIDVEGAAFNVLDGARETMPNTLFVHVEVETDYIWENQKIKKDVDEVMSACGMRELARPWSSNHKKQFDVLYINDDEWKNNKKSIVYVVMVSVIITILRKIFPSKIKYGRYGLLAKAESFMMKFI